MDWISQMLDQLNYWAIYVLMVIEGSVIPFPSELVVPPAAYDAAAGNKNVFLVILVATLGATTGAAINYAAGYYLGRPLIYKFANSTWGKLCLLNQEKVERSEKFFNDHGITATLTGRLIPGIRQIISIPAGLAKMKFSTFLFYTTVGAGLWNCVLASLGWYLHTIVPKEQLNEKVAEYGDHIKFGILAVCFLVGAYFLIRYAMKKKKPLNSGTPK